MIDNKSPTKITKRHTDFSSFPDDRVLDSKALNRTVSLPDLNRYRLEHSPLSSATDYTSSRENPHYSFSRTTKQRQITYADVGTQYYKRDIKRDVNQLSLSKFDIFHKILSATAKMKETVGEGIGEKYIDTLSKELSFIVMSRGNKTTNRGMLLHGDPGDGKTFIMEAFATALMACIECNVVYEKGISFLGKNEEETTANFHRIVAGCDQANKSEDSEADSPRPLQVLCIDEWDACIIETPGIVNDQVRVVSNLFMSSLSGSSDYVVDDLYIIATTNAEPKNIPDSLLRPGRIGKTILIPMPTLAENKIFIERFCQEYNINTSSFNPEKVAILSHQQKQSVAEIKDMVVRAHQLAEIEAMEQAMNDAVKNMASTESKERGKVVNAKTTMHPKISQENLSRLKYDHFYEVLHPKETLSNTFRTAMESFSSEYSREFYYDLDHSTQLTEALRIIRSVSNGHNKSGIIFVTGVSGSGKTAFCTELMKLASPSIFRSTATPRQLEKIDPPLLNLENEFCGRFDGFFPSNHNNRSLTVDKNVHTLINLNNAQNCFSSIVLIDNGDDLMHPLEPSQARGHRNQNASFEPANPLLYLDTWHQFIDNPENRNMILVISSTKSAHDIVEYSGIKGMTLAEFTLPSFISKADMEKVMKHYGLTEEERSHAGELFSSIDISIKQFINYMDKAVTDKNFDKGELERLIELNKSNPKLYEHLYS